MRRVTSQSSFLVLSYPRLVLVPQHTSTRKTIPQPLLELSGQWQQRYLQLSVAMQVTLLQCGHGRSHSKVVFHGVSAVGLSDPDHALLQHAMLPKVKKRTRSLSAITHLIGTMGSTLSDMNCHLLSTRPGEEATDNARVWKIYRARMTERDQTTIDGWNKALDILLLFVRELLSELLYISPGATQAGLFSAVSTAFIIES